MKPSILRFTMALGVVWVVFVVVALWWPNPAKNVLLKAPDGDGLKVVQAETTYFTYLAGLTGSVVAALLTFLALSHESTEDGHAAGKRNWRPFAKRAAVCFLSAITQVTIGYAIRNTWVVQQAAIPDWIVRMDIYGIGPFTALSYIVGVAYLVWAVHLSE